MRSRTGRLVALLIAALLALGLWLGRGRGGREPKLRSLTEISERIAPNLPGGAGPSPRPSPSAPSPSASPSRAYSKAEYLELVKNDRLCDLLAYPEAPYADQVEALLDLPSSKTGAEDEADLDRLYRGSAALMLTGANSEMSSVTLNFFNALLEGRLLAGADSLNPEAPRLADFPYSSRLLRTLENSDPDNAAFPYFHAAVRSAESDSPETVRRIFARTFSVTKFETFYSRLSSAIADQGFASATAMYLSISVNSRVPVPDYNAVSKVLNPLIDSADIEFDEGVLHLAQLMMDAGEAAKRKSIGALFGTLEYAVGRSYFLRASRKLQPGKPDPVLPSYGEWRKTGRPVPVLEDADLYSWWDIPEGPEGCDRTKVDEAFEKARAAY